MKKLLLLASCLIASVSMMAQDNLMAKANEGATGDKGAMAANGWQAWIYTASNNSYTAKQLTWDSNGPAGNNVRWENKSNDASYDGTSYTGNICFTRWDGDADNRNTWYTYPVEISTPGTYSFSVLAGGWSNVNADDKDHPGNFVSGASGRAEMMVLFSKERGPQGIVWRSDAKSDYSKLGLPNADYGKLFDLPKEDANNKVTLKKCEATFTAPSAGTYYLEIVGSRAIIVTADYQLSLLEAINSDSSESGNLLARASLGEEGGKMEMARYGWEFWRCPLNGSPSRLPWTTNGPNDSENVRLETRNDVDYQGQPYSGKMAFTRWDNGSLQNCWYVFPVEIKEAGFYDLSVLAVAWNNLTAGTEAEQSSAYLIGDNNTAYLGLLFSDKIGPEGITWKSGTEAAVGIQTYAETASYSRLGTPANGQGQIFTVTKDLKDNRYNLTKYSTTVNASTPGKYYVEIIGSHALTPTADLSLVKTEKTAVSEIEDTAEVVEIEYYGIDGIRLVNPTKGSLVIEKRVLSNGNIKVRKSVIR